MQVLAFKPAVAMNQQDLMARLSHEMRTSLTGIVGYSEFVESTSTEPMVNFTAKIIRESSQSLARASNAFFDLQRIDSGQLKLNCTLFSMYELVCDAVRLYQPIARERQIGVVFTCGDDSYLIEMYADALRVSQVVDALIYGAIQSTRKDESIHIDMTLDRLKTSVMFKIKFLDAHIDGPQVDLFKEFWCSDSYKFRLQEGPGIEQALAKSLIYFMQGDATYNVSNTKRPELTVSFPMSCSPPKRRI